MKDTTNPRNQVETLLKDNDLHGLLKYAAALHGHYCPGLAMGVKAAAVAVRKMDLIQSDGMEKIMAVVECNNCFVDGVQAISGCTIGNNAMVYRDLGKTAVTFYRRGSEEALRLCVRSMHSDKPEPWEIEARALFDKCVKRRETLSPKERELFNELWTRAAFKMVDSDEDTAFFIAPVKAPVVEYAPMVDSVTCSCCGESVMETRARLREGKTYCLDCNGDFTWSVIGRGITLHNGVPRQ